MKLLLPFAGAVILCVMYAVQMILEYLGIYIFSSSLKDIVRCRSGKAVCADPYRSSRYFYVFLVVFLSLYTLLISTVLEPYNCVSQPDGSYTMYYQPTTRCYEHEWKRFNPVVIIFLVLYCVVAPIALIVVLWKNRGKVDDEAFVRRFGTLTNQYREKCFYYEVVVMIKKISIVLASDFFSVYYSATESKVLTIVAIQVLFLGIDQIVSPYKTRSLSRFATLWSATAIAILQSVYIFGDDDVGENEKNVWAYLVIILFCFSSVCTIAVTFFKRKPKISKDYRENDSRDIQNAIATTQTTTAMKE